MVPVVWPWRTVMVRGTPSTSNVNVSFVVGAVLNVTVYVTVAPSSSPTIAELSVAVLSSILSASVSPAAVFASVSNS